MTASTVHTASPLRRIARFFSSPARRWAIGGVAMTALAALFIAHSGLPRVGHSFVRADWHWVAATLGLLLVSLALRSAALKVIADALGGVRARQSDAFSATSIGLLANAVVPVRVGTVLTPYTLYVLLRRRGAAVPFVTVLGVALTERLFAIATFVALSLLFLSSLALPAWAVQVLFVSAAFAATFLVGGVVLERRRARLAAGAGRRDPRRDPDAAEGSPAGQGAGHDAPRGGWRHHLPELVDSQRIMGKPWSALLVAGIQTASWFVQLAAVWAALQAFHLGAVGLRGAALVLVLTNLIGLVPITPGNLGTFQAAAAAALAVSAVASGPAVAFALGLQGLQLAVGVVAGLVSLSLQDLTLADLRGRSSKAAALLTHGEPVRAPRVEGPAL